MYVGFPAPARARAKIFLRARAYMQPAPARPRRPRRPRQRVYQQSIFNDRFRYNAKKQVWNLI